MPLIQELVCEVPSRLNHQYVVLGLSEALVRTMWAYVSGPAPVIGSERPLVGVSSRSIR